jgi:hypothetical protein
MLLDSYALYSPATFAGRPDVLWVGGWRTEADIGPDRIYRLDRAILAANTPDLSGLVGATSRDGLRFEVVAQVGVPAAWLLTPHIGQDGALYVARAETARGKPTRLLEWRP